MIRCLALACLSLAVCSVSRRNPSQPNIVVIWGDDIGISNISHNNRGTFGHQTENIDRTVRKAPSLPIITVSNRARLGALHSWWYSCSHRDDQGWLTRAEQMQETDVTIATVLKFLDMPLANR